MSNLPFNPTFKVLVLVNTIFFKGSWVPLAAIFGYVWWAVQADHSRQHVTTLEEFGTLKTSQNMAKRKTGTLSEATPFNSDFTSNAFFNGFKEKLPCEMMYKKESQPIRVDRWKLMHTLYLSTLANGSGHESLMVSHSFCNIYIYIYIRIDRLRTPAMPPRWKDEEKGCISRVAGARAGVTFCQHARPVNRCKKMIKSQEKMHENPAKTNVFQALRSQNPVNTSSFCFPEVQKRSKTCYLRSFLHLGIKKHRKYWYFWAKKRKKRDTYEVFCTLRQKPRYLQCFLHMALQKHRYLQCFCNISRCCLSTKKLQKHCILQCFALWKL